ncbi:MAG: signal transduction protein: sensor, domain-like protein [Ramlibacter sp.]|jgi:PAS domain-containing protein|nr:signal transduction protein: sensor, domain-like protein [Ramlibacter sp.]
MGERIRAFDWANHPMGPPQEWDSALRIAVSLCLNSSFPTAIYWGPELFVLYNDAWSEIPAEKHPWILGKPAREGWADIWDIVGPQLQQVFEGGEGLALYEQMLPMVRDGKPRETWWNYSFTPIRDANHQVRGIFNQGNEISGAVQARRQRQAELLRWQEIFQRAPAGIALLRGPTHVYEFANDAYLRVVGKSDIVGRTVAEAVPEVVEQGYVTVLDSVYAGKPFIGSSLPVKLAREADGAPEDRILDFVFQPVRDADGAVDGIFILVTDVTERARAESALRLTNWQLGEERARLASTVDAEQRARTALRRMTETLEAQVATRTRELSQALEFQGVVADRLRATFETSFIYQGFMDVDGTLRDANERSLEGIRCRLEDVVGRPFWQTPWFSSTPGMEERMRFAVAAAARGETVRETVELDLPIGRRRFDFSLRPVKNARGAIIGLVPEAIELDPPW